MDSPTDFLMEKSELQIHLLSSSSSSSSPSPQECALQLLHTQLSCSILVEAVGTLGPLPLVNTKVMDRELGTCEPREQGERGVSLQGGAEQQVLLYSARCSSFSRVGFSFTIFAEDEQEPVPIGKASLLPNHFLSCDRTHGSSCLTILSPDLQPMGTLSLKYLLINPVKGLPAGCLGLGPGLPYSHDHSTYHLKEGKPSLDIGHRGLGDSYRKDKKCNPPITENTITSLRHAGECGADLVEFDVQLTRDHVPVVYHNFRTCVSVVKGNSRTFLKAFVKDLSLQEIRDFELSHTKEVQCQPSNGCEEMGVEERGEDTPFPTLEELFNPDNIPESVGFNIEVKYPVPELSNDVYSFPYFDRNLMADQILKVVLPHAGHRKIIFSCFDADMCTLLRLKQPIYPVLYLTTNSCPQWSGNCPVDIRSRKIQDALMHAKAQDLLGVNIDSHQLLNEPDADWASVVKGKQGLALFTWGRENNHLENIEKQRELGVDGIIYDRVDEILGSCLPPPVKKTKS